MKNKEFVFEKAIVRLEEIANILEKNEVSLDESLKLFEEGVYLGKFCDSKLKDIEQKIIVLKSLDFDEEDIIVKNGDSDDDRDNENKEKQNSKKKIDKDRELF